MTDKKLPLVDSLESLDERIKAARRAGAVYKSYEQEAVDTIFRAAALAANHARLPLAKMAVADTGMGIVEDKVIKNHYAAEYIYNAYRDVRTCGTIREDQAGGYRVIAEPVGLVGAIIPTTNPTSTVIFKCLIALKTRNTIIISPHPRAKDSTIEAARIIRDAAVAAGAPADIIGWIDVPSLDLTNHLMAEADLILATGGPGMVRSAYSSGKPAIGVGPGNTPAYIHRSANIPLAVSSIIHSKTFDNGMICASEQSCVVDAEIYDGVRAEFEARGAFFLGEEAKEKLRHTIIINGQLNAAIVGQSAPRIAELAGVTVPEETKVLIAEVEDYTTEEAFAHEKLSPVLAMYRAEDATEAMTIAERLVADGGHGHTAAIYLDENNEGAVLEAFSERMEACRILVNTPSSQGGIGDLYNFYLAPSLTLGCGSWGGNAVSENVGIKHLLNYKTVAARRENMLWFRAPEKIFLKRGCLPFALAELGEVLHRRRAYLVTDDFLYQNGFTREIEASLERQGISYEVFSAVKPDPTLKTAMEGAERMRLFRPDVIIAVGGGSPMDAAKIMWLLYEHPEADFRDLAMNFMDIRKRVYNFPKLGEKASFVAIPTTAGTGSEVTPFAVITDESTGTKYPLADYELLPDMAIIDANLMLNSPPSLTAASGIDAVSHALEAYAAMMATDYTDGLAIQALQIIFEYLPRAYDSAVQGTVDAVAREKMANAATIAGMAFANAFLGVMHSMAHKLGSYHGIPHGVANALMMTQVLRFNATAKPRKMGTFPQYDHPKTLERYAELARALRLGEAGDTDEALFEALIEAIRELHQRVGIKPTIRDYVPDEALFLESLDAMAEDAFDDQCTGNNPRYPLIEEISQMYLNAYYGVDETV